MPPLPTIHLKSISSQTTQFTNATVEEMSSPYLKRGESIILTTDRVSINSLLYEVLLTTRHLIHVDARYDQFLPQKIPLSSILSVKGGKIATGEPVITLIFSDNDNLSGSGPMVLYLYPATGRTKKKRT